MGSSILTLPSPQDLDKRFETEARARRYQALGRACRDEGLTALMVAHHGDDQAETVLMRLANNRLRTGLSGMRSVEWIPECEGIYGVHRSGKSIQPTDFDLLPYPVADGGIQILRPLLAMEKSRLISTCEAEGVEWAEDKSNRVQTLTSRNAIRHIYKNYKLPEALSIQSLVNVSQQMQRRITMHQSYADRLLDQCFLKLDIRLGTLLVRFPPFSSLLERPIQTESDANEARNNAYCLIEKVSSMVTPVTRPSLGQLATRLDDIYPEFLNVDGGAEGAAVGKGYSTFTVYRVWWRRWDKASPFDNDGLPDEDFGSSAPHPREWLLTRQALEGGEAEQLRVIIPPQDTLSPNAEWETKDSYHLFDNRFWIKIKNLTNDTLVLRMFEKADMDRLPLSQRDQHGRWPPRFIVAALSLIKPSDIRFTLPAVFRKDSVTGEEILIGLPTLKVRVNGFGPPTRTCNWHVLYKKVDLGQRSVNEVIVHEKSKNEVIEEERLLRRKITKHKVLNFLETNSERSKVLNFQSKAGFRKRKRPSTKIEPIFETSSDIWPPREL
jgi:tRNA(Ile)-lysidine synthase